MTAHGPAQRPGDVLRSIAGVRPVAAYLVVGYLSTAIVFALPLLSAGGFGVVGLTLPGAAPFVLVATLGLLGAAFVVTAWSGGQPGVTALRDRVLRLRVRARWYLLAAAVPPACAVLTAVLARGTDPLRALTAQPWPVIGPVALGTCGAFILVNWWEEAAWTGFVLDRLQPRLGGVGASIATTWMQAVIHLPLVFVADGVTDGRVPPGQIPWYVVALFVLPLPVRVVATWLYNASGRSVPVVGLFHSGIGTATGGALLPAMAPGVDATWVYAAATVVAIAALVATGGGLQPGARARGRT